MKHAHSREFLSAIEHTTQVVVDLAKRDDDLSLQVKKAGARYNPSTYRRYSYAVDGLNIEIKDGLTK
jgi:hypothetical protein